MSTRDIRQLVARLKRLPGWDVKMSRGGHYRVTGPGGVLVFVPSTPSDIRSVLNARSELRKHGAAV